MNTVDFVYRHIPLNEDDRDAMLQKIGVSTTEELISQTIPDAIRAEKELDISTALSEFEMLDHSKKWQ